MVAGVTVSVCVCVSRVCVCVKRDLAGVKRDKVSVERDLGSSRCACISV